ncbi:MAG: flagellar hook-associated protein FlgK [Lachnospiraceae bacterium]|nr:flagellar hook-associated protein FlgK [Lachnospiraceae bacterium]
MGGTMGRLSIGVTALQTNQFAMNTTAHNLMNTQTDGYSRQQVMLTDRTYKSLNRDGVYVNRAGLGVITAEIKQVRDSFADAAYRTESGRMNYYKAQYETVSEVETYYGELEGKDFNTTMNNLWLSLQELQKESNSIVTRSSFIATAQTFLDRVKEIRTNLITYQRNLNVEIKEQVSRINELSKTILDLNTSILDIEAGGVESANDYRDARNHALDELSGLVNTEVIYNVDGTAEVYVEGRCIVTKGKTYELETVKVCDNDYYVDKYDFTTDSTDFLMPVWKDDQSALFNIEKIPSTETDTDIGSLKGLMMARGYFVSNYSDVPEKPEKPLAENFANDAEYQQAMIKFEQDLNDYVDKLDYFNKYVEPYTVTNLMSQFDVLVHAMVAGMNDILCPNKEVRLKDGSTIKILDEEKAGIGMGKNNDISGTELFVRSSVPRYTEKTVTLEDGTTQTVKVYNEENPEDYYSLYSAGNININEKLMQNPSLLPLSRESGAEAQEVVDAMLELWNVKFATVSPNSLVECNFMDYYAGMLDDLSDRGYTYNSMAKTQEQSVTDIDALRQQVVGVSSDEELSSLIKFQHAYNASSRYITAVSEMIEQLILQLGS